jgi:hypothetical protein
MIKRESQKSTSAIILGRREYVTVQRGFGSQKYSEQATHWGQPLTRKV